LLRLWKDVAPVAMAAPVAAPRVLVSTEEARAASWYRVVAAPGSERMTLQAFVPGADGLVPSRESELAFVLPLPEIAAEALSVRVGLSGTGPRPPDELPRAVLVELPAPLDPARGLSVADFGALCDPERIGTHPLVAAHDEPGRLSADFAVARLAPRFLLVLASPAHSSPQPPAVESIEIAARSLVDHVALGLPSPRLLRQPGQEAVSLTLDRDRRQGLLALPGRRYVFELPPSPPARRLDLALGVAPRSATLQGAIRLTVTADGATLLDERLTAPRDATEPAWRDVRLELPAGAKQLVLAATGDGTDPPLACFGHPTLRTPVDASSGAGAESRRPNVVLISIDTLRPDHLGCYGATPSPSPRLDAFAQQALRFTQAYSTSSYTLPAHGSMLTGQVPAVHGATDPADRLDPARSPFLAQMLADAGYVTAGFTGGAYMAADFGFAAGFDRYANNDPVWALDSVRGQQLMEMGTGPNAAQHAELLRRYATPMITRWIESQDDGTPFFLFAHTYVVHNYAPDKARLREHGLLGVKGQEERLDDDLRERFNFGETALHDEVLAELLPYYDATIEMADEFVGALLDALDRAGLADRTLVIVTSDHGEEFGEHGYFGHGKNLYESNVRVPLLVRLPGGTQAGGPRPIDDLVSLADLAPFVLRSVGLAPDPRMSLGAEWDPSRPMPPARERVVLELDTKFERVSAIREGEMKLSVRTPPTRGDDGAARGEAGPGGTPAAAPAAARPPRPMARCSSTTSPATPPSAPISAARDPRPRRCARGSSSTSCLTMALRAAAGDGAVPAGARPRTIEELIQMGTSRRRGTTRRSRVPAALSAYGTTALTALLAAKPASPPASANQCWNQILVPDGNPLGHGALRFRLPAGPMGRLEIRTFG
jgi:arylsulfatase